MCRDGKEEKPSGVSFNFASVGWKRFLCQKKKCISYQDLKSLMIVCERGSFFQMTESKAIFKHLEVLK